MTPEMRTRMQDEDGLDGVWGADSSDTGERDEWSYKEVAMIPEKRRDRLEAWLDRQVDPGPHDHWAELSSAAIARVIARAAIIHQRKSYPSRDYVTVPWDGAGGEYRVWLSPAPHTDGRDEYYLGRAVAIALESFVAETLSSPHRCACGVKIPNEWTWCFRCFQKGHPR